MELLRDTDTVQHRLMLFVRNNVLSAFLPTWLVPLSLPSNFEENHKVRTLVTGFSPTGKRGGTFQLVSLLSMMHYLL